MIEQTSLPLKAVEVDFAADSSGLLLPGSFAGSITNTVLCVSSMNG
jgi:hypothetical protein